MSFTVGLLELLGYLVPGAMLISIAALVFADPNLGLRVSVDNNAGLFSFLLASYVTGHLLTILSRSLTWMRRRFRGHSKREERYTFFPRLKERLDHVFGGDLGPKEEYHLARQLVTKWCPRSNERIDRTFALMLLTRNMAVAFLFSALFLAWTGHWSWAVLFAVTSGLFAFQHYRFEGTHESAVFRAAFVALVGPKMQNGPDCFRSP